MISGQLYGIVPTALCITASKRVVVFVVAFDSTSSLPLTPVLPDRGGSRPGRLRQAEIRELDADLVLARGVPRVAL
jgi:hypothetical protein